MANSVQVTGSLTISGSATGTAGHADNTAPIFKTLIAALVSSGTVGTATYASKALYYSSRTLTTNETFDLTAFSSALEEAGTSLSKVRIYFVFHESTSAATSITVGGAATPFPGQLDTAATTRTFTPGSGFVEIVPTAAGIGVTAGMSVKIVANGGTATYSIGVFGE